MNLQSCAVADVEFQSDFSLAAKVDGQLTAVVGFFDVEFLSVLHKKSFSTSPYNIPTHWKQTVFLLETPISVVAGKLLSESARSSAVAKELHDAAYAAVIYNQLANTFHDGSVYQMSSAEVHPLQR